MSPKNAFSSSLGFIAAAAGSAVGLGNIWKFPYEVGRNGGALFLILYVGIMIFLGLPLLCNEAAFGRRMQGGAYHATKQAGWPKLGWLMLFTCLGILSFYNVVTGWILGYMLQLMQGKLLATQDMGAFFGSFVADVSGNLGYTGAITLLVIWIVRAGVAGGVEQCAKLLMPLYLLMLVGLIVYVSTLPGAHRGLAFYLKPNWDAFTWKTVYSAMSLALFSIGLGIGILVTYGAYMRATSNIPRNAFLVTASAITVSFLAGLFIFPLIFSQKVDPQGGPGLLFVALPGIFKQLGMPLGMIVGVVLFLLMLFAAITSSMSLLEVVTCYGMEAWGWSRPKAVYITAGVSFILGIPCLLSFGGNAYLSSCWCINGTRQGFLELLDTITTGFCMPLGGILTSLLVARCWKTQAMAQELQQGSQCSTNMIQACYYIAQYIAPLVIGALLVVQIAHLLGFNVG